MLLQNLYNLLVCLDTSFVISRNAVISQGYRGLAMRYFSAFLIAYCLVFGGMFDFLALYALKSVIYFGPKLSIFWEKHML